MNVRRHLRERATQLAIPGIAYAVVRNGRIETGVTGGTRDSSLELQQQLGKSTNN